MPVDVGASNLVFDMDHTILCVDYMQPALEAVAAAHTPADAAAAVARTLHAGWLRPGVAHLFASLNARGCAVTVYTDSHGQYVFRVLEAVRTAVQRIESRGGGVTEVGVGGVGVEAGVSFL